MKETSKKENNPHFLKRKKLPSQVRHPYYIRSLHINHVSICEQGYSTRSLSITWKLFKLVFNGLKEKFIIIPRDIQAMFLFSY